MTATPSPSRSVQPPGIRILHSEAPGRLATDDDEHAAQVALDVAPTAALKRPAAQGVQGAAPAAAVKNPAGQATQAPPGALEYPAGHATRPPPGAVALP
jgi:hypothetical protein